MEYTLKDKLTITNDFIEELAEKSWQEIEHLQNQIANLADTEDSKKVGKLLSNLLTSYYIFVGGLENFDNLNYAPEQATEKPSESIPAQVESPDEEPITVLEPNDLELSYEPIELDSEAKNELDLSEPFEYFVDFDEPIGDPLTDEDLYNN
jgi:hypothetical protein